MSVIGSNVLAGASGAGGAEMTVLGAAFLASPYVTIWEWDSGFGSKFADPSTLPTGSGRGINFSPDGNAVVVGHSTSPYISAYPFSSSGFGTKYANPSTLPAGTGVRASFSPDGSNLAIAHNGSPYVSVYSWSSSGFGSKYSNPSTLPTGNGINPVFSPDGDDLALLHSSSPYISVYPWSSGFGSKYSNPSATLSGGQYGLAFSPDGNTLATSIAQSGGLNTQKLSIFPWSASGFGTVYTNPAFSHSNDASIYDCAWNPDGDVLALSHSDGDGPYVTAYAWSSGYGSKYSDPSTKPAGTAIAVDFSPDGNDIAVGHVGSPFVTAYPWSSGFGTKYSDPSTLITNTPLTVKFGTIIG